MGPREAARRGQCANKLRQLSLAVQNHHSARGKLPPARIADHKATWAAVLLPYLEETVLTDWDFRVCFFDQPLEVRNQVITTLLCPSKDHDVFQVAFEIQTHRGHNHQPDEQDLFWGVIGDYDATKGHSWHATNLRGEPLGPGPLDFEYQVGAMIISRFSDERTRFAEVDRVLDHWESRTQLSHVRDGTSKTFLIGEISKSLAESQQVFNGDTGGGYFLGGVEFPFAASNDDHGFFSDHPGIVQFAYCDGSVRPVRVDIDMAILRALVSRDGGEIVE